MKKLTQEDLQEGMTSIAEVENIAATVCCSYHVYLHLTMTDYDSARGFRQLHRQRSRIDG